MSGGLLLDPLPWPMAVLAFDVSDFQSATILEQHDAATVYDLNITEAWVSAAGVDRFGNIDLRFRLPHSGSRNGNARAVSRRAQIGTIAINR